MSFIINPYNFGIAYDADAQAFFNRVTAAGGTLSNTEKNATNQLVLDLKSNGIWSSMVAIYPMVGASSAACSQNLKSASFTATFNGGWTFSSLGILGNGTNSYMDTTVNALSNLSQNNTHLSFYANTTNSDAKSDSGTTSYTIQYYLGTLYWKINNTVYDNAGILTSLGLTQGNRIINSQSKMYKNGSLLQTTITPSITPDNLNIYIGAINNGVAQFFTAKRYAFASMGDGMTDAQASNFYTAVQAFNTTLSRQV